MSLLYMDTRMEFKGKARNGRKVQIPLFNIHYLFLFKFFVFKFKTFKIINF